MGSERRFAARRANCARGSTWSGAAADIAGIRFDPHRVVHSPEVDAEADRQYARLLERLLREAEEMQELGRLRDPMSQWEIAILRQELRARRSARMS